MLSKGSQAYSEVRAALKELQEGIILAIDPSIGSQGSQPGWAVYQAGELQGSGTIEIDPTASTPARLQRLNHGVRQLMKQWNPDVMVYENITDVPYKGFSARGHAPLMKALGAILSISGPDKYVGMLAASWRRCARPEYQKGDEADAIEIGWVAVTEARRIADIDPPGKYGSRRRGRAPSTDPHGVT